jgi:hypothetical protein
LFCLNSINLTATAEFKLIARRGNVYKIIYNLFYFTIDTMSKDYIIKSDFKQ